MALIASNVRAGIGHLQAALVGPVDSNQVLLAGSKPQSIPQRQKGLLGGQPCSKGSERELCYCLWGEQKAASCLHRGECNEGKENLG